MPVVLAVACFLFALWYYYKINEVSSNPSDIVVDVALFALFFFFLAFLAEIVDVKLSLTQLCIKSEEMGAICARNPVDLVDNN